MTENDEPTQITVNKVESFNNLTEKDVLKCEGTINIQPLLQKYMKIKSPRAKEFIAEVFGTFILLLIGLSSVAQYKFASQDNPNSQGVLSVNLGFGFGAVVAIILVGKVSGAHLNPAVSFAMLLTGQMSIFRFFIYSLAQFVGAFLAAFMVFIIYLDAIRNNRDGMYSLETAGIFATYPIDKLSIFGGFFDQLVGTSILVMVVLALNDKKNVKMSQGMPAIFVGFTLIVIGVALGYNCGYAINPARDLSPRLFTLVAGWGTKTFSAGHYFFWIPVVAPMVGSVFGTLAYLIFISNHL